MTANRQVLPLLSRALLPPIPHTMAAESKSLSETVTQVDITDYLRGGLDLPACQALAHSMKTFGAVLVRDPRVGQTECDTFLDMMERYFSQPFEKKIVDARPHLSYQVC